MRRILLVGLLAMVVPPTLTGAAAGAATNGTTTRVSVSSSGEQANSDSRGSSISADGRYVAFVSGASNLVPGDTNNKGDMFLRDRVAGTTSRVSVSSSGGQANGSSGSPSISADGRYVAFVSDASNLVPGDTNSKSDVFLRDRVAGTTSRVSVSSSGGQANSDSYETSISADGRFVAFYSYAANLVPGDTNATFDVFVRDRVAGTTSRVSVSGSGAQGTGGSSNPSISADGRFVAFDSYASNLVSGDTNGFGDVFVRDRVAGTTTRVNVSSSGGQANSFSATPSISADGRFVAFYSDAANLVPGDTNGASDIFVRDRVAGTTSLVSVSSSGAQVTRDSGIFPSISADGRYVAFDSDAYQLVPGDTNEIDDVFVRDRVAGTTSRVSVSSSGAQAAGFSCCPSISADGRYVAFWSQASNLVAGDTNNADDIFVHDRGGPVASDGLFANLRGAAEVPGPGDPDGLGAVILHTRATLGRICGQFSLSKVGTPTAAHIHSGSFGTAGPVVVDLTPIVTGQQECVTGISAATIKAIRSHPGQYYVNVHTADYPAGAVRGQLHI